MRIGYYIPGWPPGSIPNGIVTTLGHLGRILREEGHEVFYITPNAPADLLDHRVFALEPTQGFSILERVRFRWNLEGALYRTHSNAIAKAAAKLVKDSAIDILQMEETHGWARNVIRQVPIPVVVRLHGPWHLNRELGLDRHERVENRHRVKREGLAISKAAGVAAPSKSALELTEKFYGRLQSPTRVIANPIFPLPDSKRWKLESCDPNLILFVGRFDRIKGGDLAVQAFSKIVQQRPTTKLLFVGPDIGITQEAGQAMKLEQFILSTLGSEARQRVEICGQLTRSEVEALRTKAYLTLVASRYETFGNVVIEAMNFGCPLVTTGVGGILEIVSHNRNALVVQPNVDSIVNAVLGMLGNPDLTQKLGAQAALDCARHFDPTKIAAQTIDFYSAVIDCWQRTGAISDSSR